MLQGRGMLENPYQGQIWNIEDPWRGYNSFDTFSFRKWEYENDYCLNWESINKLKLAALAQYMSKGIPMTFYGTEAGLSGYKDPFNRKPYPWESENHELLEFYIEIGYLRKRLKNILSDGDMQTYTNEQILEITRRSRYGIAVTVINRTNSEQYIGVNIPNTKVVFSINGSNCNVLKPYGAIVYTIATRSIIY